MPRDVSVRSFAAANKNFQQNLYSIPERFCCFFFQRLILISASVSAAAAHAMAQMLMTDYGGEVPDNLDDLVKLPGVGRKTANVMQAVVWGRDAMPVDTHVFRVSHRIGLVTDKHTTPLAVEKELVKYFPTGIIATAHHWLILHGRYTCTALRPKCEACGIRLLCKHYKKIHTFREAKQKDSK